MHSRHDKETAEAYEAFAQEMGLMVSGGSDCHQDPVLMGSMDIPDYVGEQFVSATNMNYSDMQGATR